LQMVRDGRWEYAACILAQAAVKSPADSEIQTWLGEAYARLGMSRLRNVRSGALSS